MRHLSGKKYLLTITGYAAFDVLIPLSCLLYLVYLFWDRDWLRSLARKLLIFSLAIVLVIPSQREGLRPH